MAKEFDIYLKRRVTECDLMVLSLPFRDGLTVDNRMILETCIQAYALYKLVAVQSGSVLTTHIDEMLKTCHEMLRIGYGVDIEATFQTHYSLYPDEHAVMLQTGGIAALQTMFANAEHAFLLQADRVSANIAKSVGFGTSDIRTGAVLRGITEQSFTCADSAVEWETSVLDTNKQGFLQIEAPIEAATGLRDLCYRVTNTVGTAMEIAAFVWGTELHYSFGRGYSSMELGVESIKNLLKQGFLRISADAGVEAGLSGISEQNFADAYSDMFFDSALPDIFYRFHVDGDSKVCISALLSDMEISLSIPEIDSEVVLMSGISHLQAVKRLEAENVLRVLCTLNESMRRVIEPERTDIGIAAAAHTAIQRLSVLQEVDDFTLSSIDEETLAALSYTVVSE